MKKKVPAEIQVDKAKDILLHAGFIPVYWRIEDIQSVDEDNNLGKSDLKDDDLREIAQIIADNHDANIGVNWEAIDAAIQQYKGQ